MIELLIVVAIGLFLVCVALTALTQHRRNAKIEACKNDLKQIGVAFRTWALDCGASYPAGVTLDNGGAKERIQMGDVSFNFHVMSNEIGSPKILACPEDGRKTSAASFGPKFGNGNVSYFVGVNAEDTFPQMFLTGDRNLAFEGQALGAGLFLVTSNRAALSWTTAIHNARGNISLADGSVQTFNSKQLALAAAMQYCESNWLAIP